MVNMLDEVAWLFNLRGSDIDFNPGMPPKYHPLTDGAYIDTRHAVFFAYALIDQEKASLFVNESQLNTSVSDHLGPEVEVHPYDTFFPALTRLGSELQAKNNSGVSLD